MNSFPLRALIFFVGLGCISFGVALTSKAALGTTPIAAIPYSISIIAPGLSFGTWVIAFNLFLVVLEYLVLRGRVRFLTIAAQCFLTCIFGFCVDLSMLGLAGFSPESYAARCATVAAASLLLGFGAFLTLRSNVAMLPGDGFILAVAAVCPLDFGRLRLLSDMCMASAALILCWLCLNDFAGVREGTVLASLLTGPFIKLLMKLTKSGKEKK